MTCPPQFFFSTARDAEGLPVTRGQDRRATGGHATRPCGMTADGKPRLCLSKEPLDNKGCQAARVLANPKESYRLQERAET